MRRSILARFVASAFGAMGLVASIPSARAQEPLLLRIRPLGETPNDLGTGSGPTVDEEARQARARSEAVWARAERRSRIAIASVCTGCLTPIRPPIVRRSTVDGPASDVPSADRPSSSAQTGAP